jgi:hypothetical protein
VAAWTDETGKYTPVYSQDSRIDTLDNIIAAVKEQADKSVEDVANIASELAKLSSGAVANNTSAISAINTQLAQKADLANVYTKDESANIFMTESAVDSRINALINAADPEGGKTITDIQNLVKYVDENASEISTLITNVEKNLNDIVAINAVIAAMTQPKESTEISITTDGTLGIKEVNVNKLVQTPGDTLVLYGGGAV